MRKSTVTLISGLAFLTVLSGGCNSNQSASANNQVNQTFEPKPAVFSSDESVSNVNLSNTVNENENIGEIINCSPTTVYRGEEVKVSMKTPHGIYFAIRREKGEKWFFLYGGKENFPAWNDKTFTELSEITINTETAYNSTNVDVGEKPEKIFTKTGTYRFMVSREDFGQCDPPWTGMCEVYYSDKKRPNKK